MNLIRILPLFIVLTINSTVFCQSRLDFISKKNGKRISFKVGDRIGYTKKGFAFLKTGKIQDIQDSIIIVKEKAIRIEDIKFIGHRKKGTTLIGVSTATLSGFALGYLTSPDNNSTVEKIGGVAFAIPMFAIGQIVLWKNRLFKVGSKYKFEVSNS